MNSITTPSTSQSSAPVEQSYRQMGASSGIQNMVAPHGIQQGLFTAYNRFLRYLQNNNYQLLTIEQQKVKSLSTTLSEEHAKLNPILVNIANTQQKITSKQAQLTKIKNDGVQNDSLNFIISSIIVVLIMMYLFIFYASNADSAFFGTPSDLVNAILNPNVFSDADGGELIMIILFPVVFIGIGFLIHIYFERKKYLLLTGILSFTLIFDVFLAYKIARNIYENGNNTDTWQWQMAASDINFYIVIAAGFVVYIIWGFILNITLTEWKQMQPGAAQISAIKVLTQEIANLDLELIGYNTTATQLKNTINQINEKITRCNNNISFLQSGGVLVSMTELRGVVGEFMTGWNGLINLLYQAEDPIKAQLDIKNANEISNNWLTRQSNELSKSSSGTIRFDPN